MSLGKGFLFAGILTIFLAWDNGNPPAQAVIENPAKPISGEPGGLNLYRFSPEGRFLGNIAKVGQGPGELSTEITDFLVQDDAVFLFSAPSSKLIKLEPNGKLLREWVLDKKKFYHFPGIFEGRFLMLDYRIDGKPGEGLHRGLLTLFLMNEDESFIPTQGHFSIRYSIQARSYGGRTSMGYNTLTRLRLSDVRGDFLYAADGPEYLVQQVDLEKGEIARRFRREYPRVRFRKIDPRDSRQMPEFENDLHQLLVHGAEVWALTSTFDPAKGVLTDVFDEKGRFLDSFFLPLTAVRTGDTFYSRYFPMTLRGDHLYTIEHDSDWNFSIAKYEIPRGVGR
jgi:hypothetical protein